MTSVHHHHLSKPSAAVSTAASQACAACKYQRRKCAPDCILAPYFPHDRQRQFLNAHKLFGVSNITKIIRNLNQFDKHEAMRTIIFQSDARSLDPVGGCYRIIQDLNRQIAYGEAELQIVLRQLAFCKQQAAAAAVLEADPMSGFTGIERQFVEGFDGGIIENVECLDQDHVDVWEIQDSGISSSSSSSLHLKQGSGSGSSVNDFDDIKIVEFHQDDHHYVHHSEEALVKMENVMLKESCDPIQEGEDEELKGTVDTLFTFPTSDT